MMIVFCVLLGTILSWLTLNTKSPWTVALAHGSVNAVAGLPILFFQSGFDMAIGGILASLIGWIGMIIFIAWLVRTKRLRARSNWKWASRSASRMKQKLIRTNVL
jgi:membrane protease YdiL (CAAX protease family)